MCDDPSEVASGSFLVYRVGEQSYGMPLGLVERVLAAAAVTLVPGALPELLGVIDLHGQVVGVIDMWRKLGWTPRPLRPQDRFVVVAGPQILAVEEAVGVITVNSREIHPPDSVAAGPGSILGLVQRPEGLIVLHDVSRFLAAELTGLKQSPGPSAEEGP